MNIKSFFTHPVTIMYSGAAFFFGILIICQEMRTVKVNNTTLLGEPCKISVCKGGFLEVQPKSSTEPSFTLLTTPEGQVLRRDLPIFSRIFGIYQRPDEYASSDEVELYRQYF
jgi:hypothetical protein